MWREEDSNLHAIADTCPSSMPVYQFQHPGLPVNYTPRQIKSSLIQMIKYNQSGDGEMADALASGASVRKDVWVQLPLAAQKIWSHGSVGRASLLHREGHRFESCWLHLKKAGVVEW